MGGPAYICLLKLFKVTIFRERTAYCLERRRGVWRLGLDGVAWDRIPLTSERSDMVWHGNLCEKGIGCFFRMLLKYLLAFSLRI